MSRLIHLELELPSDLDRLRLPLAVDERLHELLDRQDRGEKLSVRERSEAEGLVNLADLLSLLRLRSEQGNGH
ncbi:MAG TPA: hypothetical protein VJZ71_08995 [Phycisphaerae bacterium]|nr:hypothetical protein [Phycisphaerae bacterium]